MATKTLQLVIDEMTNFLEDNGTHYEVSMFTIEEWHEALVAHANTLNVARVAALADARDGGRAAGYHEGAKVLATANIGDAARWRYIAEHAEFVHKGRGVYLEVKLDYDAIAVSPESCVDALIARSAK